MTLLSVHMTSRHLALCFCCASQHLQLVLPVLVKYFCVRHMPRCSYVFHLSSPHGLCWFGSHYLLIFDFMLSDLPLPINVLIACLISVFLISSGHVSFTHSQDLTDDCTCWLSDFRPRCSFPHLSVPCFSHIVLQLTRPNCLCS